MKGRAVSGVPVARRIDKPAELARLIREIKAAIIAGLLDEVRPDPFQYATEVTISAISESGPWPDYLELRFRIRGTGQLYRLAVEAYHGAGGSWAPD